MNSFFPFIHKIEKKKEEELIPLYIELYPPFLEEEKKEEEDEYKVIVIEL